MKNLQSRHSVAKAEGFTLIELLVVVLIIGILAAIALPQYQSAVEKSRYGALATLMASLVQSQDRYMLEHDAFAEKFDELDIEIPGAKTATCPSGQGGLDCVSDGKWMFINYGRIIQMQKDDTVKPIILEYYPHSSNGAGKRNCISTVRSYDKVCKSLGGVETKTNGNLIYFTIQ
ncbi:prepilin-type N-terminal cleavage/methylation domain-containing protein [Elusimicrobium posterum]|uniref:type IV pilin protein n=1 Tax=Elusimicrobium posterum TaxID=3116653 RepID=UPI003C75EBD5